MTGAEIRALYRSAAHSTSAIPWMLGPGLCPALRVLLLTPGLSETDEWWHVVEAAHQGILSPDWARVRAVLEDGHAPAEGDIDCSTPEGAAWAAWWAFAVPPAGFCEVYLADHLYYCGSESPGEDWLLYAVAADMQRQLAAQASGSETERREPGRDPWTGAER